MTQMCFFLYKFGGKKWKNKENTIYFFYFSWPNCYIYGDFQLMNVFGMNANVW